MTAVVDASVAIKWFLLEPRREPAKRLLDGSERLVAPELILAEVANGLWRRVVAGESDLRQVGATAASLPRFFSRLFGLTPLTGRAVEIASALNHPVYDCFYLALAEAEGGVVVTADRRLLSHVAGSRWAPLCRRLGE